MRGIVTSFITGLVFLGGTVVASAAGTLTPVQSTQQPVKIRDHHVNVTINNGFAETEVIQTFFNPNHVDLEAVYSFPLPRSASLSEVTITVGETEIQGEVLARDEAEKIYEEEKSQGRDAGLATKNGYQTFEFRVTPVRAQQETRVRFLYYQPVEIDTGIGRYLYPLEEGGTDEVAQDFWFSNEKVEDTFSARIELKSAWPVTDVRIPGHEAATTVSMNEHGNHVAELQLTDANLNKDLVFYYKLADDLPGRVELIPYRASKDGPGTFMMVVTPGMDLQPLTGGADYVFVLDVSGSMQNKIHTLALGVEKTLRQMQPQDRFKVISFSTQAQDVTGGWVQATPDGVARTIEQVKQLHANGSTNMYQGIARAVQDLDDDRATSVILVTDAVTNTGVIEPARFHELLEKYDLRVFGFLMGNNANWPLMRTISEASGGFSASVSNSDDIIGQILLAKSKITHECLHDASIEIRGVRVFNANDGAIGKVYRGQQLVIFGRYEKGGRAHVSLDARLTGQDKVYKTEFDFPDIDTDNPEIERLWALSRIEAIEDQENAGLTAPSEAKHVIRDLGLEYQLVTDHTSMVVLSDKAFEERKIERRNQKRVVREHQAKARRNSQPVVNRRVDAKQPTFKHKAPRPSRGSGGGGAIDPITGVVALSMTGLAALAARRRRRSEAPGRDS